MQSSYANAKASFRTSANILYQYNIMRAYVRYYLKYTPETLEKMTLKQLVQAFMDVAFVRERRSPMEPED